MSKIQWQNTETISIGSNAVHLAAPSENIKKHSPASLNVKRFIWPLYKAITDPFCDGYIESIAGRHIRHYWRPESTFLEVSCGDMGMERFLPDDVYYNAFDFRLNDVFLEYLFQKRTKANIALASVENIPVEDNAVDLMLCLQSFIHFPDFEKAIIEMARIAKPGCKLICSIANHHSIHYKIQGPHPEATHDWTYDEFISDMERNGFRIVSGEKCGIWVPFPQFLFSRTLALPVSARQEAHNLAFIYVFERVE